MYNTVALVMIVKDESKVIRNCLDSVKDHIDSWLIVDTGSKDDTKRIIKECLRGIPGQLYDRPWINFGYNRTESLELARETGIADYSLIIDADDIFVITDQNYRDKLGADGYSVDIRAGPTVYGQMRLFSNEKDWKYVGAVHEYPTCPGSKTEHLPSILIDSKGNGSSWSDVNKYRRHALILEQELLDDPNNARNVFYLAQSYRDSGDYDRAIENYSKRAKMGGWSEEVWYSLYQIGCLYERKGCTERAIKSYLDAYNCNPNRAEPLYELCRLYRTEGKYILGYTFGKLALEMPAPNDGLFVVPDAYDKCLFDELSICAYYTGNYREGKALCNRALRCKWSEDSMKRILSNMNFCESKL